MSTSHDHKISRVNAELAKSVDQLQRELATKLTENPNFFGGVTFDMRIQDGSVISVGTSVDVKRRPIW